MLLALLLCAAVALVLWNYSIHFIVIILMTVILAALMNINRGAILEASAEFFRQKALEEEKERAEKMKQYEVVEGAEGDDDDEDGEYEYLYVDEGVELTPDKIEELLEEQRKAKQAQQSLEEKKQK